VHASLPSYVGTNQWESMADCEKDFRCLGNSKAGVINKYINNFQVARVCFGNCSSVSDWSFFVGNFWKEPVGCDWSFSWSLKRNEAVPVLPSATCLLFIYIYKYI
jgi:hypothetical protein